MPHRKAQMFYTEHLIILTESQLAVKHIKRHKKSMIAENYPNFNNSADLLEMQHPPIG